MHSYFRKHARNTRVDIYAKSAARLRATKDDVDVDVDIVLRPRGTKGKDNDITA